MASNIIFAKLAEPFKPDQVHWRAQQVFERQGKFVAMAVCYIDSRDVQDRFDSVCGPENWSDSLTETAKGRCLSTISVRVGDQWVGKSDGAGDTDIEGEKGGLSDAFKRAAVKWGVGRYLYRIPVVWAECQVAMKNNEPVRTAKGKLIWKAWTPAGIAALNKAAGSYVAPVAGGAVDTVATDDDAEPETVTRMREQIATCDTMIALDNWRKQHGKAANATGYGDALVAAWTARKEEIDLLDRSAA